MWDLHMHTNLSDGSLSVQELCEYLQKEDIKLFSITDHNHSMAYKEILPTNIPYITGTEIATSHKGRVIEIHGYLTDPKIINNWYRNFYSEENLAKNETILFERMKEIILNKNLILTKDLKMSSYEKGISKKTIYYDLIKNNNNFKELFQTYGNFFRQALANPNSDFFINEATTYPSVEEVIDLVHSANGLAILAHPYEYGFKNLTKELGLLKDKLDGIESFHPSASYRQSLSILDFCEENNLLSSGGSDFHRFEKKVRVGLRVYEDLYDKAPFHWLHNFISKDDFK